MAFLLDDLLLLIGEAVKEAADKELFGSREDIHEQLLALQAKLDMSEIQEDEYNQKEKELLERLEAIRAREEEERKEAPNA